MAQQQLPTAQFFTPWDPAPPFAPRPADTALEQRITKLAEFAVKNGPPFVSMIRQKQQGNPEYEFLSGGPGGDYFTWKLYCFKYSLDSDKPLQLPPGQPAPHQTQPSPSASDNLGFAAHVPHNAGNQPSTAWHSPTQALEEAAATLPPEIASGFATVLANLNGTRGSIKESKEWFTACAQHAHGLAAMMALHQQPLPSYEQQLHVIYLANDVLLKSMPQQGDAANPGSSAVSRAFEQALPLMLHWAYQAGTGTAEVQQRLTTIVDHWEARQIFAQPVILALKGAMHNGTLQTPPAHNQDLGPGHHHPQELPPQSLATSSQPWAAQQPQASAAQLWDIQPGFPSPQPQPGYSARQQQPGFSGSLGAPPQQPGFSAAPPRQPGFSGAPPQQPGFSVAPPQQPQQAMAAYPPPQAAQFSSLHPPPAQRRAHRGWDAGPQDPAPPQSFYPPDAQPYVNTGQPGFGPGQPGFGPGQPGFGPGQPGFGPGQPGFGHVQPGFGPGQPGFFGMPPAAFVMGGPPSAVHAPPPDLAGLSAGPPQLQQTPTDPLSFPPGLLPALVEEHLRTEEPYFPLSKRDVERAGIPEASEPDSYLLARLDKFYAELQDYRPGTSRADLEDEQRRQRTRNALSEPGSRRVLAAAPERGSRSVSDGSYRGERRDGPAGLGFASTTGEHGPMDDPFNQYRKQRSGFYHDAITRATATANEPQPVR